MANSKEKKNPNNTPCFKEGSFVEVSSVEDGYTGALYGAKILQLATTHNTRNINPRFLVKYQTLLCEDGSDFLIETVDIDFIRPAPPDFEHVFEVGDVVDAFQLDGWWIGVVVEVREEEDDDRKYCVYFEDPPEFAHLSTSDLRVHLDLVSGKWVQPPKREDCEEKLKLKHTIPNTSEAMKSTPPNAMVASKGKGLAQNNPQSDVTTSPPSKKVRTKSVLHMYKSPGEVDQSMGNASLKMKESCGRKRGKPCKSLHRGVEKVGGSGEASGQRKRGRPAKTVCRGLEKSGSGVCNVDGVNDPTPSETERPTITILPLIIQGNSAEESSTMIAHEESNGELPETPNQSASKSSTSNVLIPESEYVLPFTKKSSIWKQFEDIEVFQKMPQKPHFRPLYEMEELLREGLAIACMVNFANLVTRLSDFLGKDPTSLSQLIDDLEKNGFDVKALKERIDEARLMKARGEKLREESQRIERQKMECTLKKTELRLEYDRIAQDKKELIAREEKILSAMVETNSIFTSLLSTADDIRTETKRVERSLEVLGSQ